MIRAGLLVQGTVRFNVKELAVALEDNGLASRRT